MEDLLRCNQSERPFHKGASDPKWVLDHHPSWGRGSNGCRSSELGKPFPLLFLPANSSLRRAGRERCCAEPMWRPLNQIVGVFERIEVYNLVLLSPEPSLTLRGWPARPRHVWQGVEFFRAAGRLTGLRGS